MRKYFILITLITLLLTQSTLALVIKTKSVPPYTLTSTPREFGKKMSTSSTTTLPVKSKTHNICVDEQVRMLAKEMQNKKRKALSTFKAEYKNATTTEAKRKVKKTYNQEIKEINKWFNQELRRIKAECKQLVVPTSTPTSTTSTQQ